MSQGGAAALEDRARLLAREAVPSSRRASYRRLSQEIAQVATSLEQTASALASGKKTWSPGAAEWFLDNRHLVVGALKQVRSDLPSGFFAQLPRIDGREGPDLRVRRLAEAILRANEGQVDPGQALRFLDAYQTEQELQTGELWALPTFLRIGVLAELASLGEAILDGRFRSSEEEARIHDRVAAGMGSLRVFATHDWSAFFEQASLVERGLAGGDPTGHYRHMDFATRDGYRRTVERLARLAGVPESTVVDQAVEEARARPPGERHVGFVLEEPARMLESQLMATIPLSHRIRSAARGWRSRLYFGASIAGTAAVALLITLPLLRSGPGLLTTLAVVISLVPAASVAIAVANWSVTHLLPPRLLPKLDLDDGIPDQYRTVVAVPVLLDDGTDLDHLARRLEMNFEGNEDRNLHFVLLTDLHDADSAELPGDARIIEAASVTVGALNDARASPAGPDGPFTLLHRERRWNATEGRWMGWERKRGKLEQLNRFLLGLEDGAFSCLVGDAERLKGSPFVITLDTDTVLPPGTAARLIGAMAHPLNRPVLEADGNVRRGYTVLQPRIETLPSGHADTRFARIYEADRGLDLYSHAVSDVYQEVLREGLFAGKGIYDVDGFHRSLEGRVPENHILSHDLFEGVHGRAGLLSDVAVFEGYPPDLLSYTRRLHRWVRGDWQILPWVFPRVPGATGGRIRNRLSFADRWKILDNLRRSLLFPSVFLLLVLGWVLHPSLSGWFAGVAVGVLGTPVVLGAATAMKVRARATGRHAHFSGMPPRLPAALQRLILALIFLPYHAWVEADAIARTLYRLGVSRRPMLQWRTALHTERALRNQGPAYYWVQMAPGPVAGGAFLLLWTSAAGLVPLPALPLAVAWLVSPQIAYWIGRPTGPPADALSPSDRESLRGIARRTWAFFEHMVGPEDHWLPPDNFQEEPLGIAAHRSSPSNVGLMLLSFLGAYDLGYLPLTHLTASLSNTFQTLDRLRRHRGHFLNWYDTRQLTPLPPLYVSTVDSGNLIGCAVALGAGLAELHREAVTHRVGPGVDDTLAVLRTEIRALGRGNDDVAVLMEELAASLPTPHWDASALIPSLDAVAAAVEQVEERLTAIIEADRLPVEPARFAVATEWTRTTRRHLAQARRELRSVIPWAAPQARPPGLSRPSSDPVAAALARFEAEADPTPTWGEVPAVVEGLGPTLGALADALAEAGYDARSAEQRWVADMAQRTLEAGRISKAALQDLRTLAEKCAALVEQTDFTFLYDTRRRLFHIGYNLSTGELDSSYYDLLASEARLASFLAIAKRDVPVKHWLHLGRPFGKAPGGAVLLSWGGTMFEYLMPTLLMQTPARSLLGMSCRASASLQMRHARRRMTAWGISESAYYETDAQSVYQYRAFGVPDLALRRDALDRLVVSPYASMLALRLSPRAVMENLSRLARAGVVGSWGLYEALDYGRGGSWRVSGPRVVRSYMAHHQGMILLALVNALRDDLMVRRFHRSAEVAAADFLLFEQVPPRVRLDAREPEPTTRLLQARGTGPIRPWGVSPGALPASLHVLSNGTLSSLVGSDGSGGLRWNDAAVTRWRSDPLPGQWGTWIYLRDLDGGGIWSATAAPCNDRDDPTTTRFSPHMVELNRQHDGIAARLTTTIPPTLDTEIRRLTLRNLSSDPRRIRVCSYGEVVLGNPDEDRRHQAYTKLFVQSQVLARRRVILHRRRTDDPHQALFAAHGVVDEALEGRPVGAWIDRAAFLGRSGDPSSPAAVEEDPPPLDVERPETLDPVHALAVDVSIPPGEERTVTFLTSVGSSSARVLANLREFQSPSRIDWAFDQARTRSLVQLQSFDIPPSHAERFQRLLSITFQPYGPEPPTGPQLDVADVRQALWGLGISGDLPIVTLRVARRDETPPVLELLRAHAYWESMRVAVDLVVVDGDVDGYAQPVRRWLTATLARMGRADRINRPGGVHYVPEGRLGPSVVAGLTRGSATWLDTGRGPLTDQIHRLERLQPELPPFVTVPDPHAVEADRQATLAPPPDLLLDNGLGGFSTDGAEYVITLGPGEATPAPWVNVMAGPGFGAMVSERGGGFTWAGNSAEHRLTTWTNDPVLDRPGEAMYIRDEQTGETWSPTPGPAPSKDPYVVRHRAGASTFEHGSHGLHTRTRVTALPERGARVSTLRVSNLRNRPRRLTVTYFAEWVLGNDRSREWRRITTAIDREAGMLTARNAFLPARESGVAFLASSERIHSATCDRVEFLGHGGLRRPTGLSRIGLSLRSGTRLDPCGALQVHLDLAPEGEATVSFFVGFASDRAAAETAVTELRNGDLVHRESEGVTRGWDRLLGSVSVATPSPALDVMVNRWLLYQSLSCRVWGRSALYQSSGAFGFRDQLQDVLALALAAPGVAHDRILDAAAHQFPEGDVLHWWHPPHARGVRTRCSDDLLWLPYAVATYVASTGDRAILDEPVPFLAGEPLRSHEQQRYADFGTSTETASVYDHCLRALWHSRGRRGALGLPLIGTGDWNDSFDALGAGGRGQSVWLVWFIHDVVRRFAPLMEDRGDQTRAQELLDWSSSVVKAAEKHAWDGSWYRRATHDDGTWIGSAQSPEGQIDSLTQSWAVLSGGARPRRQRVAMDAVLERLVDHEHGLIKLLTPPFESMDPTPGYARNYPPGIRENGGQYTHAAIWVVWALAQQGRGDEAMRLFAYLNPAERSRGRGAATRYRREPYAVAADVYSTPSLEGVGGWSWYTGSASWLYRLAVERLLGVAPAPGGLRLRPCVPTDWGEYTVTVAGPEGSTYRIRVTNPDGVCGGGVTLTLDGRPLPDDFIPLRSDGREHEVDAVLRPPTDAERDGGSRETQDVGSTTARDDDARTRQG